MQSTEIPTGGSIAVVGAGTVGSSCAWHLQRAGYRVTLIDPVDPGQSTSFGNAMAAPAVSGALAVALLAIRNNPRS